MSSLCKRFQSELSQTDYSNCLNILEGSANQGLTQTLTHFIEGLIFMNNLYENYRQTPNANYFWSNEPFIAISNDNQLNNILNVLRSTLAQDICNLDFFLFYS